MDFRPRTFNTSRNTAGGHVAERAKIGTRGQSFLHDYRYGVRPIVVASETIEVHSEANNPFCMELSACCPRVSKGILT